MAVFRFFAQLAICSWYGLRYLGGRIALFFVRDPESKRAKLAHLRGRTARLAMTRLGATFIKLGQVMSATRSLRARDDRRAPPAPRRAARVR